MKLQYLKNTIRNFKIIVIVFHYRILDDQTIMYIILQSINQCKIRKHYSNLQCLRMQTEVKNNNCYDNFIVIFTQLNITKYKSIWEYEKYSITLQYIYILYEIFTLLLYIMH